MQNEANILVLRVKTRWSSCETARKNKPIAARLASEGEMKKQSHFSTAPELMLRQPFEKTNPFW
jgi:hypothetical protein